MIFDSDAVKQLVRNYHGFYLLKEKSSGDVLHYGSEVHSCNLEVDCQTGQITVNLRDGEQHRGKSCATKQSSEYNTIHEILNDPRLAFMDEVVKQKRRKSVDNKNDDEPLTFSISAYKPPNSNSGARVKATTLGSFRPSLDFGGGLDLGSDLGGGGPPVPKLGPRPEPSRVEKMKLAEAERLKKKGLARASLNNGEVASSSKQPTNHQDLLALDYLYKTKTKTEINFLKRQVEKDADSAEKRAKLSHKQNIEKYNSHLASIPEQNELRRINWHKH